MSEVAKAIISAGITSSMLAVALAFLLKKWLAARIEKSIEYAYNVRLERIREDIAVKNRAALVADLLSEWLSRPKDSTRLNRLTFEAYLWLPSDIADDLSRRLANQPDAPDVRTLLGQVRKHLLGVGDSFDPQKINIFPPPWPNKNQIYGQQPPARDK
ncbi:MAG: hypothetical protein U9Q94_03525 [Candidatus Bipolaricaulota bacterium]|nr:hypothetical protein [Candidatus Bipolaricaulota bacterium]